MGLLFLLLVVLSFSYGEVLYVASASSLRPVVERIAILFEKKEGVSVKLSFSSSGNIYRQILGGAPYEVFLSADEMYPEALVKKGYARRTTLYEFARGKLALFSPKIKIRGPDTLLRVKRIAVANPKYAPYGRAAVEFLKKENLYGKVRSKLVYGANVGQAFQFVVSGGTEVGIVSLSLVRAYGRGYLWIVPKEEHPPIKHVAVVTVRGGEIAKRFVEFLKSKEVKEILRGYGFEVEK